MNHTAITRRIAARLQQPIPDALGTLDPVWARLYAARGVTDPAQLSLRLADLLPAQSLKGLDTALSRLDHAIDHQQSILIVGDFDADGATSTALMMLALRDMGAQVDFLVPDRFKYGYGLTPEIVALALSEGQPHLIITVDNGISSHAGVDAAHQAGVDVIITDHHLTTKHPPAACAVVNPNQPDCPFASKALAGVGVAFYVLAALATKRRQAGKPSSKLTDYLDLVALGTVADVAPLDSNNRILVANGLERMRRRQCRAGILALLEVAKREPERLSAQDLGFVLGPRINAAGRMEHMRIGIECLLATTMEEAKPLAQRLDQLNRERRQVEQDMRQDAMQLLLGYPMFEQATLPHSIVLYEKTWHQGVIGIVAGRLKEQFHRPSIVFAPSDESAQVLKGSARSIAGVHIRDAIERVAETRSGLITHFGGHAAAAGLTLPTAHLDEFRHLLDQVIAEHDAELFEPITLTDGELSLAQLNVDFAQALADQGPWGQAFPPPIFEGRFVVLEHRWLQDKHLKLTLRHPQGGAWIDAIWFNADAQQFGDAKHVHIVYQLEINHFRGELRLQCMIQQLTTMV
jgi:single-stranded-DNA-specific exonuclease